ncbi:unnamed protein product, partial [Hymenolepis diminuta]
MLNRDWGELEQSVMSVLFVSVAESGEVLGSRVITSSSGKVGPMYFKSANDFAMYLHKTRSSEPQKLSIKNHECIVDG